MDNVNSLEALADLMDRFHVEGGCVRGFVVDLGEVHDGCKKMLSMGGLEVINDGIEHGNAIGFVGVIGEEHVDVFVWDDGWVQQQLMTAVFQFMTWLK